MVLDKKALNLEMLRIAGFTCTGGIWTYPDGVDVDNGVPFFPGSLDECITWIFPKLYHIDIICNIYNDNCIVYVYKDVNHYESYSADGITPALAFCLAVKKLIVSLDKE